VGVRACVGVCACVCKWACVRVWVCAHVSGRACVCVSWCADARNALCRMGVSCGRVSVSVGACVGVCVCVWAYVYVIVRNSRKFRKTNNHTVVSCRPQQLTPWIGSTREERAHQPCVWMCMPVCACPAIVHSCARSHQLTHSHTDACTHTRTHTHTHTCELPVERFAPWIITLVMRHS